MKILSSRIADCDFLVSINYLYITCICTAQAIQAHLATLHQAQHHTQQQQQQQQQRNLSTSSLQQILLNQNFGNAGRGSGKSGKLVTIIVPKIIYRGFRMNFLQWTSGNILTIGPLKSVAQLPLEGK
jgi:hypothetical protein